MRRFHSRRAWSALVVTIEEKLLDRMASAPPLDAREQSDREEDCLYALKAHKIPRTTPYETRLASGLVEVGITALPWRGWGAKFRGVISPQAFERIVFLDCAERLTGVEIPGEAEYRANLFNWCVRSKNTPT